MTFYSDRFSKLTKAKLFKIKTEFVLTKAGKDLSKTRKEYQYSKIELKKKKLLVELKAAEKAMANAKENFDIAKVNLERELNHMINCSFENCFSTPNPPSTSNPSDFNIAEFMSSKEMIVKKFANQTDTMRMKIIRAVNSLNMKIDYFNTKKI